MPTSFTTDAPSYLAPSYLCLISILLNTEGWRRSCGIAPSYLRSCSCPMKRSSSLSSVSSRYTLFYFFFPVHLAVERVIKVACVPLDFFFSERVCFFSNCVCVCVCVWLGVQDFFFFSLCKAMTKWHAAGSGERGASALPQKNIKKKSTHTRERWH